MRMNNSAIVRWVSDNYNDNELITFLLRNWIFHIRRNVMLHNQSNRSKLLKQELQSLFSFFFYRSCSLNWRQRLTVESCSPTKPWMVREVVTGQFGGRITKETASITMTRTSMVTIATTKRPLDQEWAHQGLHQVCFGSLSFSAWISY